MLKRPDSSNAQAPPYLGWFGGETGRVAAPLGSPPLHEGAGRCRNERDSGCGNLTADDGDFDVPANARIGASWVATNTLTLHFDVERTWFSDIDSVGNSIANIFACPTAGLGGTDFEACLGGGNGAGFGWDDVTVYKFGTQWHLSATPRWTWRAGFSKTDHPIDASETLLNILAPAVVEQHFVFGGTRSLNGGREFSFGLMYAPEKNSPGGRTLSTPPRPSN